MRTSSALAKRPRRLPITVDPEVRGGEPCFTGTRVPASSLFVNLEGGVSLNEYLDAFPAVRRAQALAVIEYGVHHWCGKTRTEHYAG
jgi:uncharacterized protein (DUF433 family)